MILRNISVQGFGCFADDIEVGPFANGVNLLYAPNGTGKSTLVKAFTTALVDGYRVKCNELQEWKPWGRGLTPRIVVEFEHANYAYRLEKRFLQGAASVLLRKEGDAWKQYMQNDDADEFVRKDVLNCTPPGKGMASSDNWGLAQVLWTTQGDLALPKLAGNVVESIQRSVGATLTAAGSKIESRLEQLYAEFFMQVRGIPKKTAPITSMQREYDHLVADRAVAEQNLAEFDRRSLEIDGFRKQLAVALESRAVLEVQQKTTTERVERYRKLQSDRAQQGERKTARQALYTNLKQQSEALDATRENIAKTQKALAEADTAIPNLEMAVETVTRECYRIKDQVATASKERQGANTATLVAQVAREYVQAVAALELTATAIAEAAQLKSQITDLSSSKTSLSAPSAQELANARKVVSEEHQCALRLEMARVTVEIDPFADGKVEVIEAEINGEVALREGTVTTIPGSPNVAFAVPGFGTIRVRGPVTDYPAVRDQREKCCIELRGLGERFGTYEIERLELMRAEYCTLEQLIKELLARLNGILGNDDPKQLEVRRSQFANRIAEMRLAHPDWEASRPDPDSLSGQARAALESANAKLKDAENRCELANTELTAADKALSIAQREITIFTQKLEGLEADLRKLTKDGPTDAERRGALDEAVLAYEAARAMVNQIDKELCEFSDDPAARLAFIEKERSRGDEHLRKIDTSIVQAETRISMLAAQAPYQRFAELDEAGTLACASLETERRRMDAIKLLNDVMTQTKVDLLQSIAAPVEKAANQLLTRICVKPFGEILMNSSFGAAEMRPGALASSRDKVSIERLSGGEQEQLHLCTRLAMASELAKNERQLLVLDDVLTFTDRDRLARICELLSDGAEKLQILILTCHPERFIGIKTAKPFDLEALMLSQATAALRS